MCSPRKAATHAAWCRTQTWIFCCTGWSRWPTSSGPSTRAGAGWWQRAAAPCRGCSMRTITTNVYEALTLWYADDTRWLLEDLHDPGTICVCSAAERPPGCHWQIVSPEDLEARRDAQEDEQARLEEEHMQWQERRYE